MAFASSVRLCLNRAPAPSDAEGVRGRYLKRAVAAVLLLGATVAVYTTEWLAFLWPVMAFPLVFAGFRSAGNRVPSYKR